LHLQLTGVRSSSQHSALSAASQQLACTVGAQQAALERFGSGGGVVSVWSSIDTSLVGGFNDADENH
jgi:hypothetical protein